MASKLPDTGFPGMARSLLTDPSFVKELVNNKDLHASFDKMMKGDFINGLKEMLGNSAVRTAAANALASNKEIMDKLKPFGVQSGADIAALGGAVFDVLDAAKSLASNPPDVKAGMQSLAKAVGEISPDTSGPAWWARSPTSSTCPPGQGHPGHRGRPDWQRRGGQVAGRGLRRAQARGRGRASPRASRTRAGPSPRRRPRWPSRSSTACSKIPGSIGKLFADPQLNAAMVDSGAAGAMFNAFEKIAHGDIGGALNEIASAAGDLLGSGKHFSVAGHDLPFGEEGIENFTRLFGRFVDALPGQDQGEDHREGRGVRRQGGPAVHPHHRQRRQRHQLHRQREDLVSTPSKGIRRTRGRSPSRPASWAWTWRAWCRASTPSPAR